MRATTKTVHSLIHVLAAHPPIAAGEDAQKIRQVYQNEWAVRVMSGAHTE